eukprot:Opistho-2@26534
MGSCTSKSAAVGPAEATVAAPPKAAPAPAASAAAASAPTATAPAKAAPAPAPQPATQPATQAPSAAGAVGAPAGEVHHGDEHHHHRPDLKLDIVPQKKAVSVNHVPEVHAPDDRTPITDDEDTNSTDGAGLGRMMPKTPNPVDDIELTQGELNPKDSGMLELRRSSLGIKYRKLNLEWAFPPLILCGISGGGKRTIARKLIAEFPDQFMFAVSHTTRPPRAGEVDGEDYHFATEHEMKMGMLGGDFVEKVEFYDHTYALSFESVKKVAVAGKMCVIPLEYEGVVQMRQFEDLKALKPRYVLIKPPSMATLETRLNQRGDTQEQIIEKMNKAPEYDAHEKTSDLWDLVIVNDKIEVAYMKIKEFLAPDLGWGPAQLGQLEPVPLGMDDEEDDAPDLAAPK